MSEETKQKNDEIESLNPEVMDVESLSPEDLEDVSGGSCGTNCFINFSSEEAA